MAVFVETRTDPFLERRQALVEDIQSGGRVSTPVRRPLRGIEVKEPTYGVIRVVLSSGGFLPVIDAAGDIVTTQDGKAYTTQYTNFLIQSVSDQRSEKKQIVETFGDAYIFFYGEAPRVIQVQGLLLNTADFNWRAEWWENYERYFRGTRLVENGARIYLMYDDIIVEGYMIEAQASDDSQRPEIIPLSFQLFVTGYSNVSMIGDPHFPIPSGGIDYTQPQSYGEALRQWEESRNIQRESSIDAVRAANVKGYYLGAGVLLAQAIRDGLTSGDPSISGFLSRASAVMFRAQQLSAAEATATAAGRQTAEQMGFRSSPFENPSRTAPLRSTFRDNIDEFLGVEGPSARDLASPLSMADRWLRMDRAVDEAILEQGVNPTASAFCDMMGRIGRADAEIASREGPRRYGDGVYQTGVTRNLRAGVIRDVPFGIAAFAEDDLP
jgi:hypothetical protein